MNTGGILGNGILRPSAPKPVVPPANTTVLSVTGGGTYGGHLTADGGGPYTATLAFDLGDSVDISGDVGGDFEVNIPDDATLMWFSTIGNCHVSPQVVGDVTAVAGMRYWHNAIFYDDGLAVVEHFLSDDVGLFISASIPPSVVESIRTAATIVPPGEARGCPILDDFDFGSGDFFTVDDCPALSDNDEGTGQVGISLEGGDELGLLITDCALSQEQVDTILISAGDLADGGAFSSGGTLDLTGNLAPDLTNPDVTDAIAALATQGVDVFIEGV